MQSGRWRGDRTTAGGRREQLSDRQVVLVCNLQPATLAGHESQGMILVAEKKKQTTALECPGAPIGSSVSAGSLPLIREPLLDRKGFQAASKAVRVGDGLSLVFDKEHPLTAGDGRHPVMSGGVPTGGKVK